MKDSTLLKLSRNLSKNDLRALRKFVRSPYFNLREDVILLMDYLADNLPGRDDLFERRRVFRAVFPDQDFDMPLLRYAMSFLLTTIRDFLAIEEMKTDGSTAQIYQMQALKKRGCDEIISRDLPTLFELNEKQPHRDAKFFFNDVQIRIEDFNQQNAQSRNFTPDLDSLLGSAMAFHAIEIFKLSCLVISHKNFTQKEQELPLLEAAVKLAENGSLDDQPTALIWYHVLKCLEKSENESNFQILKQLLPKHGALLPSNEIAEAYLSAINFCIKRLNGGEEKYLREAYELYRLGIESRALLPNDVISKYTYKNVMAIAARLGEHDWAQNFLDEYKKFLPERERENTFLFNKAFFLYTHHSDYDNALTLLQQVVQFGEPLYNLDSRRMLVRIFYETGAISALESQLDSYKAYLRRHKEIGYHREHHLNFIQIVGKMITTDLSSSSKRHQIRDLVLEEKAIAERDWLLKQLE